MKLGPFQIVQPLVMGVLLLLVQLCGVNQAGGAQRNLVPQGIVFCRQRQQGLDLAVMFPRQQEQVANLLPRLFRVDPH